MTTDKVYTNLEQLHKLVQAKEGLRAFNTPFPKDLSVKAGELLEETNQIMAKNKSVFSMHTFARFFRYANYFHYTPIG